MIESYFQLQVNGVMAVANKTRAETIFAELANRAGELTISRFMSFFDINRDQSLDPSEFDELTKSFQKDCPQPTELVAFEILALLLLPLALIGLITVFNFLAKRRAVVEWLVYCAQFFCCFNNDARPLEYKAELEMSDVVDARQGNAKIKSEVNESIFIVCQQLMEAIAKLVAASRELQNEIVAAQEIAASTAQLFASTRIEADKDSNKLAELARCSCRVNQCTAQFVATVKSRKTALNEHNPLDFSHLSLHEAKKEEMEFQARMLEFEEQLNRERTKLAELCKKHEQHMTALGTKENGGDV